jgi:hypothetical protein
MSGADFSFSVQILIFNHRRTTEEQIKSFIAKHNKCKTPLLLFDFSNYDKRFFSKKEGKILE